MLSHDRGGSLLWGLGWRTVAPSSSCCLPFPGEALFEMDCGPSSACKRSLGHTDGELPRSGLLVYMISHLSHHYFPALSVKGRLSSPIHDKMNRLSRLSELDLLGQLE